MTVNGAADLTLLAGQGAAGAFTQAANAVIRMGSGDLVLGGDVLTLSGAPASITGTGSITIQPGSASRNITLSNFPLTVGNNTASLLISAPELAAITGFAHRTFGREDGTGTIAVNAPTKSTRLRTGETIPAGITFNSAVTFLAPAGAGQFIHTAPIYTTGAASDLTIRAGSNIALNYEVIARDGGDITLRADADATGQGDILFNTDRLSRTTLVRSELGDITLSAETIRMDSAKAVSVLAPAGSVSVTIDSAGNGAGQFRLNNKARLYALLDLTIQGGGSATDTVVHIDGYAEGRRLHRIANVGSLFQDFRFSTFLTTLDLSAYGNIEVTGLRDQVGNRGTTRIIADLDANGSGDLRVGTRQNTVLKGGASVELSGENVFIGTTRSFVRIYSEGTVQITANRNADGAGQITLANRQTQIVALGVITLGQPALAPSGTPLALTLASGIIFQGTSVALHVRGNIALGKSVTLQATTGSINVLATGNITLDTLTLRAAGSILLEADTERDSLGNITLAGKNQALTPQSAPASATLRANSFIQAPRTTLPGFVLTPHV